MKQAVKDKWVKALRSGKYRQGRGSLQVNDAFCCLGVLCDLAVKDGVKLKVELSELTGEISYDNCTGYPPLSVINWAGLDDPNPRLPPTGNRPGNLAACNDSGYTFPEIAHLIEENL